MEALKALKAEHPFWGYRRVWAYLKFRQGWFIGMNRVHRLMKKSELLVPKNGRLKATRTPQRSKPVATEVNQYWGMDMTKIKFPAGWKYLHVVKDWFTKEIVGWHFSDTSTSMDWLEALNEGLNRCFPEGILESPQKPKLITDNGCQPTSTKFIEACGTLKIEQIFTSFCNPKGNADTERVIRTIKEDLVWPYEWTSTIEFKKALGKWVEQYNHDFPHMALGWRTPAQFANRTPLKAA